ncbi:2-hydroxyacid dehydrogenase [Roseateles koreensis]|uniref:D-glycerate dehydrogenase n=1 Tax=Roseateles koreensis TaxID=2987526 RepID=A0ABT5KSI4_9BURK|nr:D-glycerate dehydrogenase [Roseateles koreensis]MDC8785893.1 D-glycerate dehydrogenase [Roseateles koreensis]
MKPKILVTRRIFPEVVARLRTVFDVDWYDENEPLSAEQLQRRLQGKQGVFASGSEQITAELVAACPDLKAVCLMTVGYNNVDIAACTARGVVVTNAPDVLTETTADFGFALMMAAARRITESEHYLRRGEWTQWRVDLFAGADIHGSTLGILGMGRIGQAIARRGALGFGMRVIYHNRSRLSAEQEAPLGARWVSKEDVLAQADHLVLVLPYSPASHHLIAAPELALMKRSATLTNIARGGVVDENALAQALGEGRLAAAGLDVFEGEPAVNPRLLALNNVVLTPHIASASVPTRRAMCNLAADNLIALLSGAAAVTPVN